MLLLTVSTLSVLLTAPCNPVLAANVATTAAPSSLQPGCGKKSNHSHITDSSLCAPELGFRPRPTGWPIGSDPTPGFDIWSIPTAGGWLEKFPGAQLRFHPQEDAFFHLREKILIHDILGAAIRRIESLQKPWLDWKLWDSKKPYAGLHRIVVNERSRHFVLDLGTGRHDYRGGQNQPLSNREALAVLRFFEERMQDPRYHPGAWGVNAARVDIWEDWDANVPQHRKYKGTFKLAVQDMHVGTNLSMRALPSTTIASPVQPACSSSDSFTFATNRSLCAPQLGTNFIPLPSAWPEPRDERPGDPAHAMEHFLYPVYPGAVPDYPDAELRFRPTGGPAQHKFITHGELIGLRHALDDQINRLERDFRKAKFLLFREKKKEFQDFSIPCGPAGSLNYPQEHSILELTSHAPADRPHKQKMLTKGQAHALLKFFRPLLLSGTKTLPATSNSWSPHTAHVEIWEDFGATLPRYRVYRGAFRLYKTNERPRPVPPAPTPPSPPSPTTKPPILSTLLSKTLNIMTLGPGNLTVAIA